MVNTTKHRTGKEEHNQSGTAPECDGEGILFSFSLSDEESSISRNPQQVILRLTSAQVTVEPSTQHTLWQLEENLLTMAIQMMFKQVSSWMLSGNITAVVKELCTYLTCMKYVQ